MHILVRNNSLVDFDDNHLIVAQKSTEYIICKLEMDL